MSEFKFLRRVFYIREKLVWLRIRSEKRVFCVDGNYRLILLYVNFCASYSEWCVIALFANCNPYFLKLFTYVCLLFLHRNFDWIKKMNCVIALLILRCKINADSWMWILRHKYCVPVTNFVNSCGFRNAKILIRLTLLFCNLSGDVFLTQSVIITGVNCRAMAIFNRFLHFALQNYIKWIT